MKPNDPSHEEQIGANCRNTMRKVRTLQLFLKKHFSKFKNKLN